MATVQSAGFVHCVLNVSLCGVSCFESKVEGGKLRQFPFVLWLVMACVMLVSVDSAVQALSNYQKTHLIFTYLNIIKMQGSQFSSFCQRVVDNNLICKTQQDPPDICGMVCALGISCVG